MNGNRIEQEDKATRLYANKFNPGKGVKESEFRYTRLLRSCEDFIIFKFIESGISKPHKSAIQLAAFEIITGVNDKIKTMLDEA